MSISPNLMTKSSVSVISNLFASMKQNPNTRSNQGNQITSSITGTFSIKNGIANFSDAVLSSPILNGSAKGFINLPRWRIRTIGTLKLVENNLIEFITNDRQTKVIPFVVTGLINDPQIKFDTSNLTKGGIRIPGKIGRKLGRALRKKNVKSVLEKIMPVINSIEPDSGGSPYNQSGSIKDRRDQIVQPPKKRDEMLKGLLKELIK